MKPSSEETNKGERRRTVFFLIENQGLSFSFAIGLLFAFGMFRLFGSPVARKMGEKKRDVAPPVFAQLCRYALQVSSPRTRRKLA